MSSILITPTIELNHCSINNMASTFSRVNFFRNNVGLCELLYYFCCVLEVLEVSEVIEKFLKTWQKKLCSLKPHMSLRFIMSINEISPLLYLNGNSLLLLTKCFKA